MPRLAGAGETYEDTVHCINKPDVLKSMVKMNGFRSLRAAVGSGLAPARRDIAVAALRAVAGTIRVSHVEERSASIADVHQAGPPLPSKWNARYTHASNVRTPATAPQGPQDSGHAAVSLHDLFVSPSLPEFLATYFGRQPVIIDVDRSKLVRSRGAGGEEGGVGGLPAEMVGWLAGASSLGASAARGDNRRGRLIVVDPKDQERKR